jgi:UPF0176 protein
MVQKNGINGNQVSRQRKGDKVTFEVPFRVRLSDKLFKR